MKPLVIAFCLSILYPTLVAQDVGGKNTKHPSTQVVNNRSPFRYIIVAGVSEIDQYVNSYGVRTFEVLMEDRAFNKENLITLFKLIGNRYRDNQFLAINVYTSLDAIRTPEEWDEAGLWGPIDGYKNFKFASFDRNLAGEYFSYSIPGKVSRKFVWMKVAPTSTESEK